MKALPKKLAVLLVMAAAGCGAPSEKAVVTGDGFAGVRFGMTIAEAEAALGHKLRPFNPDDDEDCRYYAPADAHKGLAFMSVDGVIARLDVEDTKEITTDTGARIGDSEQRVLDRYKGRARVEPHHYTGPEGHYVLVLGGDGKAQIVFETDGGKVVSYRAGRQPEVEWVEGCS